MRRLRPSDICHGCGQPHDNGGALCPDCYAAWKLGMDEPPPATGVDGPVPDRPTPRPDDSICPLRSRPSRPDPTGDIDHDPDAYSWGNLIRAMEDDQWPKP